MMKSYLLLIAFVFQLSLVNAQQLTPQLICPASGSISNGSTNVTWTIGETVISTMNTSSFILTNGFSQPDFRITPVMNNISQSDIKLFPNPARDFITLQTKTAQLKSASYTLLDLTGKTISKEDISDENMVIDFSHLNAATYLLNITDSANQIIQSYKIVKQ